jgi:hypothetical protein
MACVIVFGEKGEGLHYVTLHLDADEVCEQLRDADGLVRFEKKGKPLWINSRNVLYVTSSLGDIE